MGYAFTNRILARLRPLWAGKRRPTESSDPPREVWRIPGLVPVLVIIGVWILVVFLINPRGEFPLIDDWAYAGMVKSLVEGGGLRIPEVATNIIAQVFWGALFCLPFGFSFIALRISTLTLGLIGVLALYGILRETDADRLTALFGSLLLIFNPLYLGLSYTFMSDVPFTAVSLLALYFLVRGLARDSRLEIGAGLLLACMALLIRQTGLAIFLAFGLAYLAKKGWRARNIFLGALSAMLGVLVQASWDEWMRYRHAMPHDHSLQAVDALSLRSCLSWKGGRCLQPQSSLLRYIWACSHFRSCYW